MHITCPECRATLEPDEIDRDLRECPLCSASLADLDLSAVEDQLGSEDEAIAGNPLPVESDQDSAGSMRATGRQVEIIERSATRLVAHLPPSGSGTGGLGFFVIVWNGFMLIFTGVAGGILRQQGGGVDYIPLIFLSVFWLVGIGLAISWVKMRFTRLYLLLERDRLVVQRKLFRTTNRELLLGPESQAALEESYAVNDVPVYAVVLRGADRKESFGTGLPPTDKEFLAREINQFLGREAATLTASATGTVCPGCGAIRPGTRKSTGAEPAFCDTCQRKADQSGTQSLWPPLRANGSEELPAGLEVDDSDPDRVVISIPLLPPSRFQRLVITTTTAFALVSSGIVVWLAIQSAQQAGGGRGVSAILAGMAFLIPALMIVGVVQAFKWGRITISLTRELVRMSWGWGPVKIRKQFLPEAITACCMIGGQMNSDSSRSRLSKNASTVAFPALQAGGTPYPLITFHGTAYGQKVIRLVRTYLEQVTGRTLPD